ncbi:class F sortase [Nocardioides bruguierae]|uniref:Class F sortase n=1 Tax=Nocardioides bruguierae TaxID=2945102 RepID=A0A9X2D738_9ACTN|nr:class F sortase [Nocardioides bruguierae]MCM0620593.1 class F sortase [Nocardioides bruguierae]
MTGAPARRRPARAPLAVLVAGLLLALTACGSTSGAPTDAGTGASRGAGTATSTPSGSASSAPDDLSVQGQEDAAGRPVRVEVPALGIDVAVGRLGLRDDGVLEAPPRWQRAGWYAGGPRPGETGPAVIAGHVDSPTGPAAFTGLSAIAPGDRVVVTDAAGTRHVFVVTRLADSPKDSFPTRAVYGPTPDEELRLITCSGDYDSDAGGYQDNLVVYATAAEEGA